MKIGVLTFHCAANYGAVFQAYGLQEVLKQLGHEVHVVDYRPNYLITPYKSFSYKYNPQSSFWLNLKQLIRACLVAYPTRSKRNHLFQKFRETYLQMCSISEVEKLDTIIFGSDQIWNPDITNRDFDEMFIGKAKIFEGKRLISYAASAGNLETLRNNENLINALCAFDAVSVREKSLSEYLEKVLNQTVSVVLDPVLLAGKDTYTQIARTPIVQVPYLLTFQLGGDSRVSQVGRKIAAEKHLKYIEIRSSAESLNQDILSSLSPEEVLGYFKYADYVVTSSFHGTALSVLFNKQFNVVSIDEKVDDRARGLLSTIKINDRFIHIDGHSSDCNYIDYHRVNTELNNLRKESLMFLQYA